MHATLGSRGGRDDTSKETQELKQQQINVTRSEPNIRETERTIIRSSCWQQNATW
jgi:hypothetical protein